MRRLKTDTVALAKGTEVVGSWKTKPSNQLQCIDDRFGLWSEATHAQKLRFQHGVIETSDVMANEDGALNQFCQLVSDLGKRGLIAHIFVVYAVDLAGIVGDADVGFHDLFPVDGRTVLQRPNERKLNDAVVVG